MRRRFVVGIVLSVTGAVAGTLGCFQTKNSLAWTLLLGGALVAQFLASYLIDGFRKGPLPLWSFALWAGAMVGSLWIGLLGSPAQEIFVTGLIWFWAGMLTHGAMKKLRSDKLQVGP